jgi:hypothetical protein
MGLTASTANRDSTDTAPAQHSNDRQHSTTNATTDGNSPSVRRAAAYFRGG